MLRESGSGGVVLYARVCVCGQVPTSPGCVICCARLHSPCDPVKDTRATLAEGTIFSFSDWTLYPCHLAAFNLDPAVGVCACGWNWVRVAKVLLGLLQELLSLSQTEQPTAPCHEKNTVKLPSPQICPANRAYVPPGQKENTYFCPIWEIWAGMKSHACLFEYRLDRESSRIKTEIEECGQETPNDRQLSAANPVFTPLRIKNRYKIWSLSFYGGSLWLFYIYWNSSNSSDLRAEHLFFAYSVAWGSM